MPRCLRHDKAALLHSRSTPLRDPVKSEEAPELPLDEVNRQRAAASTSAAWTRLRFNAAAARWTRHEIWHPAGHAHELDDGALELSPALQPADRAGDGHPAPWRERRVLGPPALHARPSSRRIQAMQTIY